MTPLEPILSRSMEPIIQAIGFDLALQLVAHCGGTRVLMRAAPLAEDRVCRAIGADAAAQLVCAVGPGMLDVPRCITWLAQRRNEALVAEYSTGSSQAELALRYGMTERHVRRVLAQDKYDSPAESDLFTMQGAPTP